MKQLRDWNLEDASNYLKSIGLDEVVESISKAGDGNMNCTQRLKTSTKKSYIIKQSSSFCEKYPEVAAPITRLREEVLFYDLARTNPEIKKVTPEKISFDEENFLFLMEDLGQGKDFSYLYEGSEKISKKDLKEIASILSSIHNTKIEEGIFFENMEMRKLNHAHMYDIPLKIDNGLNLDEICPGLNSLKLKLVNNLDYTKKVEQLGQLYLSKGETLLHGDYYPNSWLKCNNKIFIIDPEFGFQGVKEFDIGVAIAHLYLSNHCQENVDSFLGSYTSNFDKKLSLEFAGVEIMRRLLGYAQLPIKKDLKYCEGLINLSIKLVL